MQGIRKILDKQKKHFVKGGKYEKWYYAFEAMETFLFTPDHTTRPRGAQIRDAIDLKRLMMTVVLALVPCLLFGIYNVGHQHYLALGETTSFGDMFGEKLWLGTQLVIPIVVVSYAVGLGIEFLFATIRRHPVNEGFLVTGMLIPLVLPVTIPLWQVALATAFAVIIGKEVFGGTGMNILNVALVARAFLYFAYPSEISGEVWTYLGEGTPVDGYTGATPLAIAADAGQIGTNVEAAFQASWYGELYTVENMFLGIIPGSIGETSLIAIGLGALLLIITGVGSWKIMLSTVLGGIFMGVIFNLAGANAYMNMPFYYHLVSGGFAFGVVYMATDPVTAAQTETGKWIFGFFIGVLTVLIRVVNPAYPEGIMLAILFMNVFAPLIDYYIVQANKKRRIQRATV
jgi:Na+-transporting NADH:ubiquinone oxidoreductase subunit B